MIGLVLLFGGALVPVHGTIVPPTFVLGGAGVRIEAPGAAGTGCEEPGRAAVGADGFDAGTGVEP